jgi:hypothetical protein
VSTKHPEISQFRFVISPQFMNITQHKARPGKAIQWRLKTETVGFSETLNLTTSSGSRWCNGYRACHYNKGSRGSNPAEEADFLSATKIRSSTSFGGEGKPSAPCRKILQHVKDPLRYDRDTDTQNSAAISRPVSPPLLLDVSAATRAQSSGGWIGND